MYSVKLRLPLAIKTYIASRLGAMGVVLGSHGHSVSKGCWTRLLISMGIVNASNKDNL